MRYIFPPRPKNTIPPASLSYEESRGWIWQPKYDGDRCIVAVEGKNVVFANRHGKFHPFNKLKHLCQEVLSLDLPAGATYLDGELLNNQIIVFFDILQYDGKYLFGSSQLSRLDMLKKICRDPQKICDQNVAWEITPHLWLSLSGEGNLFNNFQSLIQKKFVEGLLLRRKESELDNWGGTEYDVTWQLRCRKNTKNYRF